MNKFTSINHGDVFFVDLPMMEGSVQCGRRPCILMSNQLALNTSPIVTVIPLTSKEKKPQRSHVKVGIESGLKMESTVLGEQIITIPKSFLLKKIGKVPQYKMREINEVIKFQMAL